MFFWDFLVYLVEGLVFLVTGLQARAIIAGIRGYSTTELAIAAGIVSIVVIAARFVWIFPAAYLAVLGHHQDAADDDADLLAACLCARIHRHSRRGVAGRGAGTAGAAGQRRAVSRPRPDPVPDVRRDPGDPGGAGPGAARGHHLAGTGACGPARAPPRPRGGTQGAARGHQGERWCGSRN